MAESPQISDDSSRQPGSGRQRQDHYDSQPELQTEVQTENDGGQTQQNEQTGVKKCMATLALNPGSFEEHLVGQDREEDTISKASEKSDAVLAISKTDDAAMMLRLASGEMECFDFLINKYRRPIVHFMFRMVHNQAVAEELAQEVFLRVYRSRETYRAEARFSTWLYRIATNLAVNHARDTKNERTAQTIHLDEPDAETGTTPDVADQHISVEATMVRRERMTAIREHVMALPERQRMAVLMHKYEDMDYKQIGEVLKLSESATKSLLFRAYQALRETLKAYV